ncbi:MAG TPA: nucleoside transporter C-terminal domain-containing protein [Phycisphaerae bacterium]|nr:nucleoside transporter C-terminal domain-containing protein [Phycisphaerae bacterium]
MSEWPLRLMSFAGLLVMLAIAVALSENRRRISLRVVLTGLGLQLVLAVVIFLTKMGSALFAATDKAFAFFMAASNEGAGFLFGRLTTDYSLGAVVAFQVLPIVIFFSSLAGILYHFGVTQLVVRAMARIMQKIMDISGAESLASALFVFFGIESTTAIAHYIRRMTRSELFTLMTAFMATIAGTVMGAYVSFGAAPGHLLTASLMSAPAAIVIAKILVPETERPLTRGRVRFDPPRESVNVIDAAANGAAQGLRLAVTIGAMLIAFVGLIHLVNLVVGGASGLWLAEPLTLQRLLGWAFSPAAVVMGVPWEDAYEVGQLLGTKTILNEFLAYEQMQPLAAAGVIGPRSVTIATYALCGFANFGSVAILVGGLGLIDPERKGLFARLGVWALIAGTLAAFMTACYAGMLA